MFYIIYVLDGACPATMSWDWLKHYESEHDGAQWSELSVTEKSWFGVLGNNYFLSVAFSAYIEKLLRRRS
jgi:hypothetical protein